MRRRLIQRFAALLLTSLLVGAICQGFWGFFWLAVVWTAATLLLAGLVKAALDRLVPPLPYE